MFKGAAGALTTVMFKGLKRLAGGGLLLRELRGIRLEIARVADEIGRRNAHDIPILHASAVPDSAPVEVTFVRDEQVAALMQIELDLTAAKGLPPSEDEIVREYDRRYPPPEDAVQP